MGVLAKGTPRVESTAPVPSIAEATAARVVDIAGGDLEARVLDGKGVGMPGESDDVVVLVERQSGEEPPGRAVGSEHCDLHELVPFAAPRRGCRGASSTRTPASPPM
jgi:hypothetical protein